MAIRRAMLASACVFAPGLVGAQTAEINAYAKQVLSILQPSSIRENREYCGFIGRDRGGRLAVTPPKPGSSHRCTSAWPDDMEVIASYHTHSAFDADSWSELPSSIDVEGDETLGIDGYVSTPGGRLWFVDSSAMVVTQVCGIGCLPADPRFDASVDGKIRKSYTYEELVRKLDE